MFIKTALEGGTITIHGDGKQTRSMAHVDDVVRGTLMAMESRKALGQIINIGSDEEISVRDSAKIIIAAARRLSPAAKRAKIRYIAMKNVFGDYKEISRRVPDLSKARALLGYKSAISFRSAVRMVAQEVVRDT
jgi:UDP-glucose 4-epimerase